MRLQRHGPDDAELGQILELIRHSFAFMDGRIDPPSSMHRLSRKDVARQCSTGEVWSLGIPPVACGFFSVTPKSLYLGKLAVAQEQRGRGHARTLVDLARRRAETHGLRWLELQSRVELIENHAFYKRLGFVKTGETAHAGYDRATSFTFRKPVAEG